jgi:hypothetical protein
VTDIIDDQIEATEVPEGPTGFSRRKLLIGGGVGALALVAAACGSDDNSSDTSSGTPTTAGSTDSTDGSSSGGGDDVATAKLAASLEVLAVGTYKAALDAATAGKLGAVPPAVGEFVGSAMAQHQTALDAWNGVITGAGGDEVAEPPSDLKATVDGEFAKVTDVVGAAKLALLLEQTAADTYLKAVPTIQDKDAIALAAGLQCVCQEHTAILHYVLGTYPVPDTFQKGDKAYSG